MGFEPTDAFTSPVFKTGAFDHSAISPCAKASLVPNASIILPCADAFVNKKPRKKFEAPVYSVIALSRQAFCSYTFFIFSQRKDGENVAECYKTIEYPDRKAIAALYAAGAKAGQIAKEIGVAPRTIYAELKRGREGDKLDKNFRPSYDADLAQKRAQESLRRRGRRKGGPAE